MDKIKTFYSSNMPWKVISIVLGFLFWIIGVNINNPTITQVIEVELELLNIDYVEKAGLTLLNYEELSNTEVNVNVKGTRLDIQNLKNNEDTIRASVDFKPVNVTSSDYVGKDIELMINVENTDNDIKILNYSPQKIELEFDNVVTQSFEVNPVLASVDKNRYISNKTPNVYPKQISITGPETIINTIDDVTATIDVADATESFTESVNIKVLDINGRNITNELKLSQATVEIPVEINKGSTIKVLQPTITGIPKENIEISAITYTPDVINVVGDEGDIKRIEYITMDPIDITGIEETTEYTFDVRDTLKEFNLTVEQGTPYEVKVTVEVFRLSTVTYRYYIDDILIQGMKDNITGPSYIDVTFEGAEEIISELTKEDIDLTLDLRNIEEGINSITVTADLPEGVDFLNEIAPTVEFYYSVDEEVEEVDIEIE